MNLACMVVLVVVLVLLVLLYFRNSALNLVCMAVLLVKVVLVSGLGIETRISGSTVRLKTEWKQGGSGLKCRDGLVECDLLLPSPKGKNTRS